MNFEAIKTISIVGLGHVGFVTGLCLTDLKNKEYNVIGVDKVPEIVKAANDGKIPFHEPGLNELLKKALQKDRFFATTNYADAIPKSDLVFITVPTPSIPTGATDYSYIKETSHQIGKNLDNRFRVIIIKSTVIPGTTDGVVLPILEQESHLKAGDNFGICVIPEFFKEGTAVNDFLHPDRTVIGFLDAPSGDLLEQFFKPFGGPIFKTNLRTAEMIKYANNAFLATKVSFINEMANICRLIEGVDVREVAQGIGLDERISPAFLRAGCGFGGSCFPKDLKGIINFAKDYQYSPHLLEATLQLNEIQAQIMIDMALSAVGSLQDKKIAILGLAFKPNTSDMREASSIRIINRLLEYNNIKISAYDPEAIAEAKKIFGSKINYCENLAECLDAADLCFIVTEWDEFRGLSPEFFKKLMKTPIIIDGRKIYDVKAFSESTTLLQIGFKPAG